MEYTKEEIAGFLSETKRPLMHMLKSLDIDGLGEIDAKEFGEHFQMAIDALKAEENRGIRERGAKIVRGYVETLETIECGDDYELKFAISFAIKTLKRVASGQLVVKGGVEMNNDYLIEKRIEVLEKIKPICEAFGIEGYDYEIDDYGREALWINDIRIACSCNSISAVVDELIGYIFINTFCKNRSLGAFEKQVKNSIKEYWINVK